MSCFLIISQITRVCSSPSSSTTGFATLIFFSPESSIEIQNKRGVVGPDMIPFAVEDRKFLRLTMKIGDLD